jgi:hypothetical protein
LFARGERGPVVCREMVRSHDSGISVNVGCTWSFEKWLGDLCVGEVLWLDVDKPLFVFNLNYSRYLLSRKPWAAICRWFHDSKGFRGARWTAERLGTCQPCLSCT